MIILEDLKPILEPLLEDREDASAVIEQVMAIDKEVEASPDIEKLNEEWQAKLDDAIAEAAKDKEESIKRIFFGEEKAEELDTSVPDVIEEVSDSTEVVTGDNITIDDLFKEGIID